VASELAPGSRRLRLDLLPGRFAVCRLEPDAAVPDWASGELCSLTRTAAELSVVCPEGAVPRQVRHQGGWRCLEVRGPLAFELTGVLASLASPLAAAGVPLFALSTFDTDYLLVPGDRLEEALRALTAAGHSLHT
jgi:hypothetical protein